jgi:hypothetical protein
MPSYNLSGEQIAGPRRSTNGGQIGCGGNPTDECSCGACICCSGFIIGILVIILKYA